MATKIRLKRGGAKKAPHYRVVVMESSKPRDGRAVEELGYYDPKTDPATVVLKEDRVLYWLLVGAQPTDTVRSLLQHRGLLKRLEEARQAAKSGTAQTEEG